MSKLAYIEIEFYQYNQLDFLELMVEYGWNFDYCGFKNYFPLGNDHDGVLKNKKISNSKLMDIIQTKVTLNEVVGVSMIWRHTNIGADFFLKNDSVSVTLSTLCINSSGLMDVNWYLDKIIYPTINSEKISIEHFKYFEDSIY